MTAQRTSLNVSLTPELEQFILSRVFSGRYQTARIIDMPSAAFERVNPTWTAVLYPSQPFGRLV